MKAKMTERGRTLRATFRKAKCWCGAIRCNKKDGNDLCRPGQTESAVYLTSYLVVIRHNIPGGKLEMG
jgi:hypothetical protein